MEQQEFQKKLEELGRLAQTKENRLRTEEIREFLKDMELTEEQFQLVYAYLASRMITVEGYVPAREEAEEEAELTPEEQSFLEQYQKEMEYLTFLEEEELLELCREAEETGDGGAKARLTEQLLPEVLKTARSFAGRGLPFGDLVQEGNIGLMLAMETLGTASGRHDGAGLSEGRDTDGSFPGAGGSAGGAAGRRSAGGAPESSQRRHQKTFR